MQSTGVEAEKQEDHVPQTKDMLKKLRKEVKNFFKEFSFVDNFLDPQKPWILIPNGSFFNAFDWVPRVFRSGPWNIFVCLHLALTVYLIGLACVYFVFTRPQIAAVEESSDTVFRYYEYGTPQWCYNLLGFAWTSFVAHNIVSSGAGFASWTTFTVQTWTLILVRHGLATLVPFFPSLVTITEYLRFPMLVQTTITFVAWNLVLGPLIFFRMDTPAKKKKFIEVATNFRLTQLHVFLIAFAAIQGIWATPARRLTEIDACVALLILLQYKGLYLLVLDRLGIHLYLLYSPRTYLAIISWTITFAAVYVCLIVWRSAILAYGGDLESG